MRPIGQAPLGALTHLSCERDQIEATWWAEALGNRPIPALVLGFKLYSGFHSNFFAMKKTRVLREFKQKRHKHSVCVEDAVSAAEQECARRGHKLTATRRRVLELVWESHEPVKAYDVLDKLRKERSSAAPPTVYRALDFLREEGLVHRIASLNAFVGCGEPASAHTGQFLICKQCGTVAEMDDIDLSELIAGKAEKMGFTVARETIEIEGLCAHCQA